MRIYLDNCAFNRPFDDQSQIRIKLETEAKLYIQEHIREGSIELIWSFILDFENSKNPFEERRQQIAQWKKFSKEDISDNERVRSRAKELAPKTGLRTKDLLHISCAFEGKCEYFITTDDIMIKKTGDIEGIQIVTPTAFLEMEETE